MAYNPNNPNGQATSANSAPVVIASDQSAVAVSAASLPLPSGAATETTLSALNTKVPSSINSFLPVIESVDTQVIKTIRVAYTASQTAATVLTPTSGKKFVITDIVMSATGAGTVYLFDNSDTTTTSITPIMNFSSTGGMATSLRGLYTATAANNLIKYTSGTGAAGSILVNYYEI